VALAKGTELGKAIWRLFSFFVSRKPFSVTRVQGNLMELLTRQSCPGFLADLRA